jgi:hypothetical protein
MRSVCLPIETGYYIMSSRLSKAYIDSASSCSCALPLHTPTLVSLV